MPHIDSDGDHYKQYGRDLKKAAPRITPIGVYRINPDTGAVEEIVPPDQQQTQFSSSADSR